MNFIGYLLRQLNRKKIMMRVLIIFMLVTFLPNEKPPVLAGEDPHTVYLPIVLKNNEEWLDLFNQYRKIAGLNPVTSNNSFNYGLGLHTSYLLKCPEQASVNMHEETVCSGWTTEGKTAGGQSNMVWNGGPNYSTRQAIDIWMMFASHRYNMLHPDISSSGFNLSCDNKNCAAGLNILGSLPKSTNIRSIDIIYPVENQQGIPPTQFPITWAFYMPWNSSTPETDEVRFVSASIVYNGNQSVPYKVSEPNHNNGSWDYKNQIVLIPDNPLLPNQTYRVRMTVSFKNQNLSKDWSFTTASTP
jgi:hypothetical protein